MGQRIQLKTDGATATGYLAQPGKPARASS